MMKRSFFLLCALLLLLPLCAFAVTSVPAGVTEVEAEAFMNTGIDALIIPASVQNVGADVLKGTGASYMLLNGASTRLESGAENGVAWVFAPASSPASQLPNFCPSATLVSDSGLYYCAEQTARPLCAQNPSALTGVITIPKLLGGVPVATVEGLYLTNTGVTGLRIPNYLGQASGIPTENYPTMFLAAPAADRETSPAGHYVNWTTNIEGAYGDVLYTWTFTVEGESVTATSTEPAIKFAPMMEGECTVTVQAVDAVGDTASATGGNITLTEKKVVRRALLVGNTYPGAANKLDGPDTDVFAMLTILNSMSATPYKVSTAKNITASGIQAAMATTFAGAQPSDVSLFYFSGHGTEKGELVGTNNTLLSVYGLRSALQKIPGTKIVLLDACYSGMVINRSAGETASTPAPSAFNRAIIGALSSAAKSSVNLEDEGYIVLTSCRKDQTSASLSGGDGPWWGVFTYGLCYGSGYDEWHQTSLGTLPADTNGDQAITLGEAYNRVQERVNYIINGYYQLTQSTQYYGDKNYVLWAQ